MENLRILATDAETGLQAFVVVDSLVDAKAMGGTRMTTTVTVDEVAALASRMTVKLRLAGIPMGGAKAGIVCGLPLGDERDRKLAEFGRVVAPLLRGGIYLGSDQGVSHRDRDMFFDAAGYAVEDKLELPCSWTELWRRCEDITGFGVCESIDAARAHLQPPARYRTAVIQGFGSVGRAVATGLVRRGISVVAVADRLGTIVAPGGLPIESLLAATDALGTVDRARLPAGVATTGAIEAWVDVTADILVLAAGGGAIRRDNVERVTARIVVEGANLACTLDAQRALAVRGVPVLPDVAINTGGAAVTALLLTGAAPSGLSTEVMVAWLHDEVARRIRSTVANVIDYAAGRPGPLSDHLDAVSAETPIPSAA